MKSQFSSNSEEISPNTDQAPTHSGAPRSKKAISVVLAIVALIILLKTGLTIARFTAGSQGTEMLSFPKEVLAEERKGKSQDLPQAKKKDAAPVATAQAPAPPVQPMTETLSYIEQRETELKKKEEQLRQKEEYLTKMEQDVEKKLKDLTGLQKEIQAYRSEKEETQNAKIRSLAKIYGTMKPKEAAKLLDNLDEHLVVAVISTMSPDEAASILGNMDVKKAAKISESLSHR